MGYKDLIDRVFNQTGERWRLQEEEQKISEMYMFSEQEFVEDMETAINGREISERERVVLYKRFSFNGYEFRTLEGAARDFGVTRERIRQMESKALRKLKHPSRSRSIRRNIRLQDDMKVQEELRRRAEEKEQKERAEAIARATERGLIQELELSVRARNCLRNDGIEFLDQLAAHTEKELLRIPNFGRKSLNELRGILALYGLEFKK